MSEVIEFKTGVQRTKEEVIAALEDALEMARQKGDYIGVAIAMVRESKKVTVVRSPTEDPVALLGAIEYLKYRAVKKLDECSEDDK